MKLKILFLKEIFEMKLEENNNKTENEKIMKVYFSFCSLFFFLQMSITNMKQMSGSLSQKSLSNSSLGRDDQTLYCLCQSNDCSTFMM